MFWITAHILWLAAASPAAVVEAESFRERVAFFNRSYPEEVRNAVPDAEAWQWMRQNIPYFTCPDQEVEELYYYRWWAWRKHIRQTPRGYIITEFLKPVQHATDFNAISCAFGHHVAEGRWLHERRYLSDYAAFWLQGGQAGALHPRFHQFSGWAAAALYDRYLAEGDRAALVALLPSLVADYRAWEIERQTAGGLFWQRDVADGMEESASGGRKVRNVRPSINSYLYGDAQALAAIARLAGDQVAATRFAEKARTLRRLVEKELWNPTAAFFETRNQAGEFVVVREAIGFTPWYFDLPERGRGYEAAWKELTDAQGFDAPAGPTTVERRSPLFQIAGTGDDCQWNGPNWPFATTITLRALANVLDHYPQQAITPADYFRTFLLYTRTQHLRQDRRTLPFIDENLNPLTGEWWARARADDTVEVHPLLPENTWDWFCLDHLPYHGHTLTIVWDRTGERFGRGLSVWSEGRRVASAPRLGG